MCAYVLQPLTEADIAQCHTLSGRVGWATPAHSWQRLIRLGQGYGIWHGDRLAATAIAMPYIPKRGWLANIITDPDHQRQGLGERVTCAAIASLQNQGIGQILLDATEMGAALYKKLGFVPIDTIGAWYGTAEASAASPVQGIKPELAQLVRLDAQGFGVERRGLIASLVEDFPDLVWADGDRGFLMGQRLDETLARLGPWNHEDPTGAARLFQTGLHHLAGMQVRVDIPAGNTQAQAVVKNLGFTQRSSCRRMLLGAEVFCSSEYGIAATATG